jgi:hypothetical protein
MHEFVSNATAISHSYNKSPNRASSVGYAPQSDPENTYDPVLKTKSMGEAMVPGGGGFVTIIQKEQ